MSESDIDGNRTDRGESKALPNGLSEQEIRAAYVKVLEEMGASQAVIDAARQAAEDAETSDASSTPA